MEKEERILFPHIRSMLAARAAHAKLPPTPFGTIQHPLRMMEAEHQQAGEDLWLLRGITNGYEPPSDACATWRAGYAALEAVERISTSTCTWKTASCFLRRASRKWAVLFSVKSMARRLRRKRDL